MKEIELKAHVTDRTSLIAKLNKLAVFCGEVTRDDSYWALPSSEHKMPSIRIRQEKNNSKNTQRTLITYKRKEVRKSSDGVSSEVNEELETQIENALPLEAFLKDSQCRLRLTKHKDIMAWTLSLEDFNLPGKSATLELCTVPPLGDFLEIEILCDASESDKEKECQQTLVLILDKLAIPHSDIEPRYYSELLATYQ